MKFSSVFLLGCLALIFSSRADSAVFQQEWACGKVHGKRGQALLGAPYFSLRCIIDDSGARPISGPVMQGQCMLSETPSGVHAPVSTSSQFQLVEGEGRYTISEGKQAVHFFNYQAPFWRRAKIVLPFGAATCEYPAPQSRLNLRPERNGDLMDVEDDTGTSNSLDVEMTNG